MSAVALLFAFVCHEKSRGSADFHLRRFSLFLKNPFSVLYLDNAIFSCCCVIRSRSTSILSWNLIIAWSFGNTGP